MPKVEIEESELASLQAVSKFVDTGLKNPKTRTTLLGVQKILNPDAVIPELDAADGVMRQVKAVEDKLDGFMTKLTERDARDEDSRRTAELQGRVAKGQEYLRGNGYNEDGVKKVEELMLQEGVASYAAGLALFERINPTPKPASASSSRWGTPVGADKALPDNKSLWESQGMDDDWLREAINSTSDHFRQ